MREQTATCKATGHRIYKTWEKANFALNSIKMRESKDNSDLRVWDCSSCGYKHVGHFKSYIRNLEILERQGRLDEAY